MLFYFIELKFIFYNNFIISHIDMYIDFNFIIIIIIFTIFIYFYVIFFKFNILDLNSILKN